MTATGNEAVTIAQAAKALDVDAQNSGATGDEPVRLRQLKMLRDSLTANITATVTFVTPYGYSVRAISYIDENHALVTSTDESVQIPIPQIAYINYGGSKESSFSSSGNCSMLYHSFEIGAYYIYGDTTFTASM